MRLTAVIGELGPRPSTPARQQVKESRVVERIGLSLIELTLRERQELETEGSLVVRSASGPAVRAGIRQGDMILAINGAPVEQIADLHRALTALAPGSVVALLVLRDDARTYLTVRLPD